MAQCLHLEVANLSMMDAEHINAVVVALVQITTSALARPAESRLHMAQPCKGTGYAEKIEGQHMRNHTLPVLAAAILFQTGVHQTTPKVSP